MWSLHLPVEPHCPRCCPASFAKPDPRRYGAWPSPSTQALWKSFRNDPDHRSDNSLKLTDLKSESVISFISESRSGYLRNRDHLAPESANMGQPSFLAEEISQNRES